MPNTENAAAARKAQAEYLEGLQREARVYKDGGRKDRLAEVQAEIKRVESLLDPAVGSAPTKRGGKGGKGAATASIDTVPGDASDDATAVADDGKAGA